MQKKFNEKDSAISFMLALFLPSILAIFCIIILSMFINSSEIENSLAYKILATLISQVSFLIICFFVTKSKKISFKQINHNKLDFKQIMILLLISACCLFLISPIINVYDSLIVKLGVKEQTLPLSLDNPLNFVYLLLSMGIFAPISEELLFRGIILQGLEDKGKTKAVLISSLMFMIMHLSLHQTIYQFVLGIIMALIVIYTQSIFASIFVHFVNNSVVLVINYINPHLFDYKYLETNYIILAVVLFLFALFVLFYLLRWLKHHRVKNNRSLQTSNEIKGQNINKSQNLQNNSEVLGNNSFDKSTQLEKNVGVKKINWLLISLVVGAILWLLNLILQ